MGQKKSEDKGVQLMETWKDIDGYEGYYQVSDLGRVKSLPRKDRLGRNHKGRTLKPFSDNNKGYLCVELHKFGVGKTIKIHRLVAIAFIPNPFGKPQVNHGDGNKKNNCADNLEWSTSEENIQHSFDTNLNNRKGERNSQSKLTIEDVKYIRENFKSKDNVFGAKPLAEKFKVEKSRIYKIVRRTNWENID